MDHIEEDLSQKGKAIFKKQRSFPGLSLSVDCTLLKRSKSL